MAGFKNVCWMLWVVAGWFFASACGPEGAHAYGTTGGRGDEASLSGDTSSTPDSSPGSGDGASASKGQQGPTGSAFPTCTIGGVTYRGGDAMPGNDCETCQPGLSTECWVPNADATSCSAGGGGYCSSGTCVSGCLVGAQLYLSQEPDVTDSCMICDPSNSSTALSKVPHCAHKASCDIAGATVADGTMEPGNPNACCNTSLSTTTWTPGFEGVSGGAATFSNVENVVLADIDNDGRPDMIVATQSGLELLIGKGDGTFSLLEKVPGEILQVAAADLNGDGRPDLVILSQDDTEQTASVVVWLNEAIPGSVGFTVQSYRALWPAVGLAVGDFLRTGSPDIAVIGAGSSQGALLMTLANRGDGTFGVDAQNLLPGVDPSSIVAGRVGGDVTEGLVIMDGLHQTLTAFLYAGGLIGFLPAGQIALPTEGTNFSLALADLNGDGLGDLIVSDLDESQLFVLVNAGGATFNYAGVYATSAPSQLAVGDFNGDGVSDLAIAGGNGIEVLINETKPDSEGARFASPASYPVFGAILTAGDVSGDGKVDVVAVGSTTTTLLATCP